MPQIARVGQGYDIHRLESGRKLVLAGVEIVHEKGLAGHSDADVVVHALIDALLGAAGLDDIGEHFPDTDPAYKNIDSKKLLAQTIEKIGAAGYIVANVDITIIAERPKLSEYKEIMKRNLSGLLAIPLEAVGVKAKTNESLGAIGRGEAIACMAVASLAKK